MSRRFDRAYARFSVDLVWGVDAEKFKTPGSVLDISQGGLRVQTAPSLIPGQILHVFLEGHLNPSTRCRVVWAQTHGSSLPSEAGLEILERSPWLPTSPVNLNAPA